MRALWALILWVGILLVPGGQAVPPESAQRIVITSADELRALSRQVALGDSLFGRTVSLESDLEDVGCFLPIGSALRPFEGTFEGNGHVVSGLAVDGYLPCSGLFGCVGKAGCVRGLTLRGCLIAGGRYTGALAGYCAGRTENCRVQSSRVRSLSEGEGACAGALIGALTGSVRACEAADCAVEGSGELGGLVGRLYAGSMRLCRVSSHADGRTTRSIVTAHATGAAPAPPCIRRKARRGTAFPSPRNKIQEKLIFPLDKLPQARYNILRW